MGIGLWKGLGLRLLLESSPLDLQGSSFRVDVFWALGLDPGVEGTLNPDPCDPCLRAEDLACRVRRLDFLHQQGIL